MSDELEYPVALTAVEAQALRLASIFGKPDPIPEALASARAKLNTIARPHPSPDEPRAEPLRAPEPPTSSVFSAERAVVLLFPIFGGLATWLVAWCATHLPGHPHLSANGVEGLEVACFLSVAAVVVKWLHGRQLLLAAPPALDEPALRRVVREEIRGETAEPGAPAGL